MPYVSVQVEVDIIDFDSSDLQKELERRGYQVTKGSAIASLGDLEHVEHLALCGLLADAQQEALMLVGTAIGRPIH